MLWLEKSEQRITMGGEEKTKGIIVAGEEWLGDKCGRKRGIIVDAWRRGGQRNSCGWRMGGQRNICGMRRNEQRTDADPKTSKLKFCLTAFLTSN